MRSGNVEFGAAVGEMPCRAGSDHDPVRRFFAVLPRPLRFLGVGGLGLITDLAVFTLIIAQAPHPLLAGLSRSPLATLVTWRLNRALTFDRSRPPHRRRSHALRRRRRLGPGGELCGLRRPGRHRVTALPQLAVIAGAACGALVSYSGQALFAFGRAPAAPPHLSESR